MRKHLLLLLLVTLAGSAVGFGKEKPSLTLEFSVAGMSCDGCAQNATKVLKKIHGVQTVTIDFASQHAVVTGREITREQVEEALGTFGFEARFSGDTIVQPLSEEEKGWTMVYSGCWRQSSGQLPARCALLRSLASWDLGPSPSWSSINGGSSS